jgi:asparagine synthase (glutamine-hydrolysing)
MCGIVGFAGFYEPGLLRRMCNIIVHRGPDGEGMAEWPQERMAIGMRRLAIIDLVTGDQPFVTPDRLVTVVFNGEIYNFRELRDELRLQGHGFKTQSDTEVLLAAYLEWGIEAWSRLHGMFAIAIVDRRQNASRLLIVRDRVGMKPLYYCEREGRFLFASEIKALLACVNVPRDVSLGAIRDYLALRYVPGPGTLFRGIRKLPAGHMAIYENSGLSLRQWWAPPAGVADQEMSAGAAQERFGAALRMAVRRHLVSDVPVGAFLSGGVDSNVIVALMAEATSGPVRTFSIGFPGFPTDELNRAALTARAFSTDHTPIECTANDMAALPDVVWSLDEPVGDAIVVPLYVLAREARKKVKVVLSGEGADEILGGYVFHKNLLQIERMRHLLPCAAWPLIARLIEKIPVWLLDRIFEYPGRLGLEGRRKLARLISQVQSDGSISLYRTSISLFDAIDIRALAIQRRMREEADRPLDNDAPWVVQGSPLERLIQIQFRDWLPDLILGKFDKMTMAHSIEGRVPFMDDAVITAAACIPPHLKLAAGTNKKPLRDFARSLLPAEIADAAKAAFYIPVESYIRSAKVINLIHWALDPARIGKRGLFNPDWANCVLQSSADGGFLPLKQLFAILSLELWFEKFCPDVSWS